MQLDDFKFKKRFGQNFLKNDSIPRKIVECTDIKEDSLVIEIGPGAGILTRMIASNKNVKQVLAYEIDTSLEEILDKNLCDMNNVCVIYDDFLNRNIHKDLEDYKYTNLYVVANLPYYITTPILMKLIEDNLNVEKIVIMIQKEVALRFSAKPDTKDYSSITVFLNYFFDIKKEINVDRNLFNPRPNVKNTDIFFKLVRDSFKFKRKTIRNNLKGYDLDKVSNVLEKYNLDLTVRAEHLPIEVFVDISNNL